MEAESINQSYEGALTELEKVKKRQSAIKLGAIIAAVAVLIAAIALIVTQIVIPAQEKAARQEAAKARMQTITKSIKAGDTVKLGVYPQKDANSKTSEMVFSDDDIEWRVLTVENGKALLVSKYALDAMAFNSAQKKGNSWETSDLRKWLASDFKSSAFTEEESALIVSDPFCLSVEEAQTYFASDSDRSCKATAYAKSQRTGKTYADCVWWLRSAGPYSNYAACVADGGKVKTSVYVDSDVVTVRPALWVNL